MPERPAECLVCGTTLVRADRGRPSLYCSRACQAKAHRARRAAAGPGVEVQRAQTLAAALARAAATLVEQVATGRHTPDVLQVALADARHHLAGLAALAQVDDSRDENRAEIWKAGVLDEAPTVPDAAPDDRPQPARAERAEIQEPRDEIQESAEQERPGDRPVIRPLPATFGAGYSTEKWPGSGRTSLLLNGERIGYAEKALQGTTWRASVDTRHYKTRQDALVQVALAHERLLANRKAKAQRDRRIARHERDHGNP